MILKAYTNGLFEMKEPTSLKEVWEGMAAAMNRSNKVEQWSRKSTFHLTSQDHQLGITEAMLTSQVEAIGYDLSKVEGCSSGLKGFAHHETSVQGPINTSC